MTIHDILSDDEPPVTGWYFMVSIDPNKRAEITPEWWDGEARGWRVCEGYPNLFEPTEYFGRYWAEDNVTDTLSEVLK